MIECLQEWSKVSRRWAECSLEALITLFKRGQWTKAAIEKDGSRIGQRVKVSVEQDRIRRSSQKIKAT
jgi:hypothetical protein